MKVKDHHENSGVITILAGLLLTLLAGFTSITGEKTVYAGEHEIAKGNQDTVNWQPYIGIGVTAIGGAFLLLGRKRPSNG